MRTITVCIGVFLVFALLTTANAQRLHKDPVSLVVMSAEKAITIDGRLTETDWQRRIFHLNYRANYKPDDGSYSVTGSDLPTKGLTGTKGYSDTSSAQVFFIHYGTDLYIGVNSTDSSVCKRWGAWEGDGLFIKVKPKTGGDIEYKLMFNGDVDTSHAIMEVSGNAPAGSYEGASYLQPGTIANNNSAPDKGYQLEMLIRLDKLGYTVNDTIPIAVTVMDPDYYTRANDEGNSPTLVQFYKSWWGSEWGGAYGKLILGDKPVATANPTTSTITLDGKLDEAFWGTAPSIVIGPESKDATNWWYMQWADSLANYGDRSQTMVKFIHKGTDLYIGFTSNDSSVTNWSTGWEADGMFIWMRDKLTIPGPTNRQEIKLMFFGDSVGGPAVFEVNNNVPTGGAEGIAYNFPGTVPRTETNGKDKGYSGEVVIHADKWGYVVGDTVRIGIIMWDPDYSSRDVTDSHRPIYAKSWWGSEWADVVFDKYYMYRGIYLSPTAVGVEEKETVPASYSLRQNYPNPFNPSTVITYAMQERQHVTLTVYNLLGEEIATLVSGVQNAGVHSLEWNGRTSEGHALTSGIYFVRIQAGSFSDVRKMMLLK